MLGVDAFALSFGLILLFFIIFVFIGVYDRKRQSLAVFPDYDSAGSSNSNGEQQQTEKQAA